MPGAEVEKITKGGQQEKEYFLGKLKTYIDDDDEISKLEPSLKELTSDTALYELVVTYEPGEIPFAIALVLYDPESGSAYSVVALLVPEPTGALLFALSVGGLVGISRLAGRRPAPAIQLG